MGSLAGTPIASLAEWRLTVTAADVLVSLAVNLMGALLAFFMGVYFDSLELLFGDRRLFRGLFGRGSIRDGNLTITLDVYRDTRLLSEGEQKMLGVRNPWSKGDHGRRFYKQFPTHLTAFPGAWEDPLGVCSARGAMYLAEEFGKYLPDGVRVTSDVAVSDKAQGTFVNLGSSSSNI